MVYEQYFQLSSKYPYTTLGLSQNIKSEIAELVLEKLENMALVVSSNLYYHFLRPTSIFHCAVGIVPSSVVLTSFQVMSRVFLIWAVTHSVKEVQSEDSVLLFVIAWTITEIIRYSFYTFSLLNHLPYLIKWARYTLFIVLYPMGVSGELLTIYAALPFVRQAGLYSISLPNKYNFSFDYYAFLILVMISYIPLFPQLYFHMLHQRRKVLSHAEEHKKSE
ncbi:very-long-chain (3R)-3-hydroxyacyl-CoA dehydratase 2 [Erinaceus europaeus]|uniref:Very-long-chain (3R)-3-hydroxyacyl-CoA dehydratase n=1 Tax=Erinaceus europaeus TaxID=9365 RepID=A0ABM3XW94_ERIEU|nr:very-long-chain (3R)-3-hydroxyacyl-CoA dehydratase 2 [Erinaceus europaeus]